MKNTLHQSRIQMFQGLLCLLLLSIASMGCKALGLGNITRKADGLKQKAVGQGQRVVRRGASSQGGAVAPTNDPQARQVRSRLKYALQRLEKRCPLNNGPLNKYAMRQCHHAHRGANKTLASIRPAYHQEPMYGQISNYVKELDAKIPQWKQQNANAKANKAQSKRLAKKYDKIYKRHQWVVHTLWKVKHDEKMYLRSAKHLRLDLKRLKRFPEFLDWCKTGEYKSIAPSYRYKKSRDPAKACGLAQEWKPLFTKYVNTNVSRTAKKKASWQKSYMNRLQEKHKLTSIALRRLAHPQEHIAEQQKAFAPVYAFLGVEMPKDSFAKLSSIAKGYRKLLRRSARVNRFPRKARFNCGSCRRAFANAGRSEGFSLIRSKMLFAHWSVKKNRLGIPLRRYRTGFAMFRKKGERFCRIYSMTATAQYRGGGRYTTPSAPGKDLVRYPFIVSRCR